MTTAAAMPDEQVKPGPPADAPSAPAVRERSGGPADEMKVAAGSNPQALASAISYAIYDNRSITLRAIGAGAIGQTMKALAIARGFVAPRGIDLAFIPGWANAVGNQGEDMSAMTFRVIQL